MFLACLSRAFGASRDLAIPRLGRVTLITGMNNSGKTSILEAIRLLAEQANPNVIREILQFREENAEGLNAESEGPSGEAFLLSALFHNFPSLSDGLNPIIISCLDDSRFLHMKVGWFMESEEDDGFIRLVPVEPDMFGFIDGIPALIVETELGQSVNRIDRFDRTASNRRNSVRRNQGRVLSRFVSSLGPEKTELLGPLWGQHFLGSKRRFRRKGASNH